MLESRCDAWRRKSKSFGERLFLLTLTFFAASSRACFFALSASCSVSLSSLSLSLSLSLSPARTDDRVGPDALVRLLRSGLRERAGIAAASSSERAAAAAGDGATFDDAGDSSASALPTAAPSSWPPGPRPGRGSPFPRRRRRRRPPAPGVPGRHRRPHPLRGRGPLPHRAAGALRVLRGVGLRRRGHRRHPGPGSFPPGPERRHGGDRARRRRHLARGRPRRRRAVCLPVLAGLGGAREADRAVAKGGRPRSAAAQALDGRAAEAGEPPRVRSPGDRLWDAGAGRGRLGRCGAAARAARVARGADRARPVPRRRWRRPGWERRGGFLFFLCSFERQRQGRPPLEGAGPGLRGLEGVV